MKVVFMERFLALEASAGSGKTFYLAIRYISLLFLGAKIEEIICLTFTNKATIEMKERIESIIENLNKNSIEFKEIKKMTGLSDKYLLENIENLKSLNKHSFKKIMTIDSFIGKLLKNYAKDLNLNSNFNIGLTHPENEISNFLFQIENLKEYKYFSFIKEELNIQDEEFYELFLYLYSHDFELEIIKEKYQEFDFDEFYQLKEYIESNKLLNDDEMKYKYFRIKEILVIKSLFSLYEIFKTTTLENKIENNLLSFNDISHLTYNFIKDNNKDILYFRCNHLLIDEFQDTGIVQYKILEPFIEDILKSEDGTFFYVGDIKQSIYGFRGSNPKLFHFLYRDKDLKLEFLKNNYRSSSNIVHFVNDISKKIFKNYKEQKAIKGWNESKIKTITFDNSTLELELKNNIEKLLELKNNYNDITILCRNNYDVNLIKNTLNKYFPIFASDNISIIEIQGVYEFISCLKNKDDFLNIDKFNIEEKYKNILIKEFKKYENLKDYIFHIEKLKVLENKVDEEKENSGIKIMTIHKAKGLEFENVIVMDYLKEKHTIDEKIFFYYDTAISASLYVDFLNRNKVDLEYLDIKNKKIEEMKQDENNLLYVAITRAKNSLTLFKNKIINKSFFENYLNNF